MIQMSRDSVEFRFPVVGVTITVPPQSNGSQVGVQLKTVPDLKLVHATPGFTPKRLVINFAFVEYSGNEPVSITSFDPPVKLEVLCLPEDMHKSARDGGALLLGYWDEVNEAWSVLNKTALSYDLVLPGRGCSPFAEVYISDWPADPLVAWGD